jgi:hypothetical protein
MSQLDRKKAIELLEQEQARAAALRGWLQSHLGPEVGGQQFEEISRATDSRDLSEEQNKLLVSFGAVVPPGFQLTEEQIEAAARALLSRA